MLQILKHEDVVLLTESRRDRSDNIFVILENGSNVLLNFGTQLFHLTNLKSCKCFLSCLN